MYCHCFVFLYVRFRTLHRDFKRKREGENLIGIFIILSLLCVSVCTFLYVVNVFIWRRERKCERERLIGIVNLLSWLGFFCMYISVCYVERFGERE